MAASVPDDFRILGIPAGWTELLGVVGALTALSILPGLMIYSYETKDKKKSIASSVEHYFRISGIPASWTELDVVCALKSFEPTAIIHGDQHLSLYPACSGFTQTGVFKLENSLELLKKTESDTIKLALSVDSETAIVDIDCHFYGFTPLNTPQNEHIAE
jgi:hypothetical protein